MKFKLTAIAAALAFSQLSFAQVSVSATELKASQHLNQIGAPGAWKYASGKNVTVAVVDSGVNPLNLDLVTQLVKAPNVNFTSSNTSDTSDKIGHGTHVAGIIAAAANGKGVVGVAPDAKVVAIKVANDRGQITSTALSNGIKRASELAPIMNISIGGIACCTREIQYAVNNGALLVVAAGNNGQSTPLYPARYAKDAWAKGQIIAVGAVDQSNNIASWSNRAGDTQNFFLVAPGQWILSTVGTGTGYMSGTSMAAPVVAGAAALVKSRWTYLSASQIADVLFKSATDLGAPGTDPIYGRGLLNVDRAMQPIGMTVLATKSGSAVPTTSIAIVPSTAFSASLKGVAINAVQLDEFGRDFEVDLSKSVKTHRRSTLTNLLTERHGETATTQELEQQDHLFATVRLSDNKQVNFGALGSGLKFFKLNSTNKYVESAANLINNPVFSFVPNSTQVGYSQQAGRGLTLKFAALTTNGAEFFNNSISEKGAPSNALAGSVVWSKDRAALGLTVSVLNENRSLLGGRSSGLQFNANKGMTFATLEGAADLGNKSAAFAQVTVAQSGNNDEGSTGFSANNVRASAFKLGITKQDLAVTNDRATISLEQPLRVNSGHLSTVLPVAMTENGELQFARKDISLATPARELQLNLSYTKPLNKLTQVQGFAQFSNNPGHDATAPNETVIGIKFFKSF